MTKCFSFVCFVLFLFLSKHLTHIKITFKTIAYETTIYLNVFPVHCTKKTYMTTFTTNIETPLFIKSVNKCNKNNEPKNRQYC